MSSINLVPPPSALQCGGGGGGGGGEEEEEADDEAARLLAEPLFALPSPEPALVGYKGEPWAIRTMF